MDDKPRMPVTSTANEVIIIKMRVESTFPAIATAKIEGEQKVLRDE